MRAMLYGVTIGAAIAVVLFAAVFLAVPVGAQMPTRQQEEMVSVPKSSLTTQQLAQYETDSLKSKVEQYGNWVGVGREIGVAVNDGLSAVSAQANNFAQTPVGKWTIAIIIFKVAGQQLIRYSVGLSMLLIGFPVWLWSYRKFLPHRELVRETVNKETPKVITREYKENPGSSDWRIGHFCMLGVLIAVTALVLFA